MQARSEWIVQKVSKGMLIAAVMSSHLVLASDFDRVLAQHKALYLDCGLMEGLSTVTKLVDWSDESTVRVKTEADRNLLAASEKEFWVKQSHIFEQSLADFIKKSQSNEFREALKVIKSTLSLNLGATDQQVSKDSSKIVSQFVRQNLKTAVYNIREAIAAQAKRCQESDQEVQRFLKILSQQTDLSRVEKGLFNKVQQVSAQIENQQNNLSVVESSIVDRSHVLKDLQRNITDSRSILAEYEQTLTSYNQKLRVLIKKVDKLERAEQLHLPETPVTSQRGATSRFEVEDHKNSSNLTAEELLVEDTEGAIPIAIECEKCSLSQLLQDQFKGSLKGYLGNLVEKVLREKVTEKIIWPKDQSPQIVVRVHRVVEKKPLMKGLQGYRLYVDFVFGYLSSESIYTPQRLLKSYLSIGLDGHLTQNTMVRNTKGLEGWFFKALQENKAE